MSRVRAANKDLRLLIKAIEAAGASVVRGRRGGHWKVYLEGRCVATLAGTPSDRRAHLNVLSDLRKAGIKIA